MKTKYNEEKILKELREHVLKTYSEHYAQDNDLQTVDIWDASGSAITTTRDNAIKYLNRYGKKEGYNKKDLLKAMHMIMFLWHFSLEKTKIVTISSNGSPILLSENNYPHLRISEQPITKSDIDNNKSLTILDSFVPMIGFDAGMHGTVLYMDEDNRPYNIEVIIDGTEFPEIEILSKKSFFDLRRILLERYHTSKYLTHREIMGMLLLKNFKTNTIRLVVTTRGMK